MTEWTRTIALVVALALPRVAFAEPPTRSPSSTEAPESSASEASVRAALADGDLEGARVQAVGLREADPSLANFRLEAEVHEARGDYASARVALEGARASLPEDDASEREAIDAELAALDERSRGRVTDEPPSTHRERLDAERAERLAALQPPAPAPTPVDTPPRPVPIVKKWYFWVTLTTIVGAAVAITAVAIDANVGNDSDAARVPTPSPAAGGLTLIRF